MKINRLQYAYILHEKKSLSYDVTSESVIKPYIKNDNPLVD